MPLLAPVMSTVAILLLLVTNQIVKG